MTAAFGARREQLAQFSALLSGVTILVCYGVAALALLAPFGVESGDFLANLRSAFFAFKIGDVTISLASAATAILLFAVTFAATQGLRRWLDVRYLPLTRLDTGLRHSIGASLGYAGFILAAAIGLGHLGLGFDKLAIVAGALSVGIGFGLQSIVNNFVSGLILLWERVIRVGDWVVVGDEQGYVKRINVRSTEIETFDRATMIVPNSNLVAGVVKNWLRGDRVGRIKIMMAPHSGVDPEKVRDVLLERRARPGGRPAHSGAAGHVPGDGGEFVPLRTVVLCRGCRAIDARAQRPAFRSAPGGSRKPASRSPPNRRRRPRRPFCNCRSLEKLAAAMAVTGVAIDEAIKADANQNAEASEAVADDNRPAA